MAKQIAFNIKLNVDGKEVVSQVTTNVDDMRKAWDRSAGSMKKFTDGMFAINNAVYALKNVASMLDGLTGAFKKQQQAEQQLENSMRNAMNATEDEIQAIKDYCSAQQRIGVIGDEVQLAGAKELAMHVQNKEALEKLIPVMNDVLVHQKGLNVTSEDAQNMGARLGKVLDGNIALMSRMGFSVSDAQKALFQYGDEADRIAVITEVIEAKVGGMNEQLAKTDAGKAKQIENAFGDILESVGSAMSSVQGFITTVGNIAFAATGIMTVTKAFAALNLATVASTMKTKIWAFVMKSARSIALIFKGLLGMITTGFYGESAAAGAASATTWSFVGAIKALMAITVVGAVIALIGQLLMKLVDAISGTEDAVEDLAGTSVDSANAIEQANQMMSETMSRTFADLMTSFTQLKSEWEGLRTEGEKTEWIRNHASELDKLGLSEQDVLSAEQFFKQDTQNVVNAFKKRAEVAAQMAKLTELYAQKMKLEDQYNQKSVEWNSKRDQAERDYYNRNKVRVGQNVTDSMIEKYGLTPEHYNERERGASINLSGVPGTGSNGRVLTASGEEYINRKVGIDARRSVAYSAESPEMRFLRTQIHNVDSEIETTANKLKEVNAQIGTTSFHGGSGGSGSGSGSGRHGGGGRGGSVGGSNTPAKEELKLISNPVTEAQYENNIRYYREKMTADLSEAQYNAYYDAEQAQRKGLEKLVQSRKAREYVAEPKSNEDFVKNIQILEDLMAAAPDDKYSEYADEYSKLQKAYLQFQLERAKTDKTLTLNDYEKINSLLEEAKGYAKTKEEVEGYNQLLAQNARQKYELENADIATKTAEEGAALDAQTKTFEDLDRRISYHQQMMQQTDGESQKFHNNELRRLQKLRDEWEKTLSESVETDVTKLKTLEQIDAAISKLQDDQQSANAEEIESLQRSINLLEKKRQSLMAGVSILEAEAELSKITSLEGKDRKSELKTIGFEGFGDRIKELKSFLNETADLTDDQKARVESLIDTYRSYQKELISTFDTYREGWNGIQGIGDGIQGLTDALNENKNAWETVTGVINGLLQVYDGIMGIINLVNMFSSVSNAAASSKMKEAAATELASGAQVEEAATLAANATASIPAIAANKALAQSFLQLASAEFFAAHGSIPFVGPGLAAGYTAMAEGIVQGIQAIPLAKGGLISGPTYALVGEYAGASHNPEVVAPLDKLRSMLYTNEAQRIEFRLKGEDIVGAVSNYTRIGSRSGRRSNIAL